MRLFARRVASAFAVWLVLSVCCATAVASSVNYGDISHKNLKDQGQASTGTKLPLEIGMIANQSGIASAVKSASNATSSSFGKYLSISSLQSKYGASSSRRNAVTGAFTKYNATATVDVFHLRVVTTITIGTAQKMFGTHWHVYLNSSTGAKTALPVNTPKLPSGLSGNVDTVAGLGHVISSGSSGAPDVPSETPVPIVQPPIYDGGTPTRTGTISPGCASSTFPSSVFSSVGLFPNQIDTAYGISALQAAGFEGQGINLAILGEAPTPTNDVSTFRNCFGFQGTSLKIHNAGSIKPILESSLDAMTVAMVAPKLNRLDLWVKQLGQDNPQGAIELLASPIQATTNGTPLPNVISISYGVCEASVKPYSAARTLFDREAAAIDALGITIVVAAGDSGSSACAHGVKQSQLTSYDEQKSASWPAVSPWVLAAGGTNISLTPSNTIASSGVWNDDGVPRALRGHRRGRWRRQHDGEASVVADRVDERQPAGARRGRIRRRSARLRDHLFVRREELPAIVGANDHLRRWYQRGDAARGGDDRAVGPVRQATEVAQAGIHPTDALLDRQARAHVVPRYHHRHQLGVQQRLVLQGGTRLRRSDGPRLTDRQPGRRATPPLTRPTRRCSRVPPFASRRYRRWQLAHAEHSNARPSKTP